MRVVSFADDGRASVGVVVQDGVVDVGRRLGDRFRDLAGILERCELSLLETLANDSLTASLAKVSDAHAVCPTRNPSSASSFSSFSFSSSRTDARADFPIENLSLLPLIRNPEKILCVGLNYHAHRVETGRAETDYPVLFTRFASTLVPHGQPIMRPSVSSRLDYEGELAVVIGRRGRHVTIDEALGLVAGYCCFNDASVRDWQRHTHQFTPGKNFPRTGGIGPWLVTADEIPDPQALDIRTRVNGVELQRAHTSQMIFSVPRLISYISQFCELLPGDIIATGTPSGVGYTRNPPIYLAPGDQVDVEIERVGILRNTVVDEASSPARPLG